MHCSSYTCFLQNGFLRPKGEVLGFMANKSQCGFPPRLLLDKQDDTVSFNVNLFCIKEKALSFSAHLNLTVLQLQQKPGIMLNAFYHINLPLRMQVTQLGWNLHLVGVPRE
jgi:hypothetical protein